MAGSDSALVTGCSEGGLGEGIVRAFAKEGIHVFATARNLSSLAYLQDLENITILQLDVTKPASISAAVQAVIVSEIGGGKLKYLVNNAGRGYVGPLLDGNGVLADERAVFETNVWGPLAVIRAFAPVMIQSGGGTVVNVGSSAGVVNVPWNGIYAASKAAINILSETLRLEIEPLGIKTLTVVAGIIKSNFFANLPSHPPPSDTKSTSSAGTGFKLTEESYYKSLEPAIAKMAKGEIADGSVMSAEEFGRRVVRDVLGGKRGKTYTGTLGWAVPLMGLVPGSWLDAYCRRRGTLDKFVRVE